MDPLKLLNPDYLLDVTPGPTFLYFWPLLIFFVLVFALSFKVKPFMGSKPNAKLLMEFFGGVPSRMREFALLGMLLTFFRNEDIPYLGMRVLFLLLFVLALSYAFWSWRNYKKHFHEQAERSEAKSFEDKYLPKPKKRHS